MTQQKPEFPPGFAFPTAGEDGKEVGDAGTGKTKHVKFPRIITGGKGRNTAQVVIYGKTKARPSYRIAYYEAGRRVQLTFPKYSAALAAAETKADDLATKGKAPALTRRQLADAQAAFEVLADHFQSTGRKASLLVMAKEYCESAKRLGERPLSEAVTGFLNNIATVKRIPLKDAVNELLLSLKPDTLDLDEDGCPALSPAYYRHLEAWLSAFVNFLPGHAVCDLTKEHIDLFFSSGLAGFAKKTKTHYRNTLSMFIRWAGKKDYLPQDHRLFDAASMERKKRRKKSAKVRIYTPEEFQTLLDAADANLRPALAICGLSGVRTEEMLRMDWQRNVWRLPNRIEITGDIAKTRGRRHIKIVPSLALWLADYTQAQGPIWAGTESVFQKAVYDLCDECGITRRKNGLRHSWFSYKMAITQDERAVALEGGNTPQMVFAHYRELVTDEEAAKWFAVAPLTPANVVPYSNAAAQS